jgi:EmrB/QacA subfamily drug resistance transporter
MKLIPKKQINKQKQIATSGQNRFKAIALTSLCLALFMVMLDDTGLSVALPKIQVSLSANMSELQWILNAYTLAVVCLVLPSGKLGDMYGRKRLFLAGLVIFTTASVICGLAPNLDILIVGRMVQGIGAASVVPGSLSILADTFPDPKEKAKAIGIWSAVSGLALVGGPVVNGLLVDTLGWQSVFFINLPLGIITIWLTLRFVKEVGNPRKQHLDVLGFLLSIVLLVSLIYAFIVGNAGVWHSPLVFSLLAVAGFSFLAFLIVESRSTNPMLPLDLLNNPTFAVLNVVSVLITFTVAGLLFIFNLFLQQVQGHSAAAAGIIFLPMNGAFIFASFISGWLATKMRARLAIATGLAMASVAAFSFTRISVNTEYGAMFGSLILSGFGTGLAFSPLLAAAMSATPPSKAGIASAVLNVSNRLGGILGIALQGTILTHWLTSDLRSSLSAWNLPSNLQERLIGNALHGGIEVSSDLPVGISPSVWHQAFGQAFISGVDVAVSIASIALLAGAFLVLAFVQPTFKQAAKNSPASARANRK